MNFLDREQKTAVRNESFLIDDGTQLLTTMPLSLGSEENGGIHLHFPGSLQGSFYFFCSYNNATYSLLSFPKPVCK